MNQNQIDRLYKVAISRNAYANKMAEDSTKMDFTPYDPREDIGIDPRGFIGSPREGLEGPVGPEILPARNGPAPVASTTGFNFDTFKKILSNKNVQIGAGVGAAGGAG